MSTFVKESDLATVAKTGDYDDLDNKPTIPTVPTNVSAFTNDAGYLVSNDVSTFITEDDASVFLTADDVSTFITSSQAAESFEVKAWRGTQAEYDALTVIEQNKIYIILPES